MTWELLKTLHLIFIVTWFAGLFYLPRLFVYHASTGDQMSLDRFKTMEAKLYWIIMTPSAILTLIWGLSLWWVTWEQNASSLWLWFKLLLVLILCGYHGFCGWLVKRFAADQTPFSGRFFRWFNEIPSLFLIAIIALAVFKPLA